MGEEDTSFNPEELDAQLKSLRARKRRNWEARKLRVAKSFKELIRVLGGKCEARNQGKGRCRGPLSVEHRNGRTWSVGGTSWPRRVAVYWEEYKSGVALGVLCLGHNTSAAHLRKLLGMNRRKR